jgi:hypothetical protein
VIQCTEEFDRQQTSEAPPDSIKESETQNGENEEAAEEDLTLCLPDLSLECQSLTQSQLKDILRVVLIVLCAVFCGELSRHLQPFSQSHRTAGMIHARESQSCDISEAKIDPNYASPEDAREQLLAYARAHFEEEACLLLFFLSASHRQPPPSLRN